MGFHNNIELLVCATRSALNMCWDCTSEGLSPLSIGDWIASTDPRCVGRLPVGSWFRIECGFQASWCPRALISIGCINLKDLDDTLKAWVLSGVHPDMETLSTVCENASLKRFVDFSRKDHFHFPHTEKPPTYSTSWWNWDGLFSIVFKLSGLLVSFMNMPNSAFHPWNVAQTHLRWYPVVAIVFQDQRSIHMWLVGYNVYMNFERGKDLQLTQISCSKRLPKRSFYSSFRVATGLQSRSFFVGLSDCRKLFHCSQMDQISWQVMQLHLELRMSCRR